jgi:hypothetical protein
MAHHRILFNSQFSESRFGFLPDRTNFNSSGSLTGLRPCPRFLFFTFMLAPLTNRADLRRPARKNGLISEPLWSCESFSRCVIKKTVRLTEAAITFASKIKDLKFVSPLIVISYQGLALSPPKNVLRAFPLTSYANWKFFQLGGCLLTTIPIGGLFGLNKYHRGIVPI